MTIIIFTGTPGTGKTALSEDFSKHGYIYLSISDFIAKNSLSEGFDVKRGCDIVDEAKLAKFLTEKVREYRQTNKNLTIDGHLAHCLSPSDVDLCVVTKCDLKELKKRLDERGYSEEKTRENLDCEIFDICANEAKEKGHTIFVADTTSDSVAKIIEKILKQIH